MRNFFLFSLLALFALPAFAQHPNKQPSAQISAPRSLADLGFQRSAAQDATLQGGNDWAGTEDRVPFDGVALPPCALQPNAPGCVDGFIDDRVWPPPAMPPSITLVASGGWIDGGVMDGAYYQINWSGPSDFDPQVYLSGAWRVCGDGSYLDSYPYNNCADDVVSKFRDYCAASASHIGAELTIYEKPNSPDYTVDRNGTFTCSTS